MKQYLIVGPAWVGDMIMAQCLFKLLKQRDPTAQIDVVAPKSTHALLQRMPEVRDAILVPLGHREFGLKTRYQLGKQLREKKYDHAIVTTNSWKSALIPFFANIPKRTGWVGECRYGLLNDARRLDKTQYPLMIERFMALALNKEETLSTPYPKPNFAVNDNDIQQALQKVGLPQPQKPVLALCPGAAFGPAKRWPPQHFAAVAKAKIKEGWDVWIFGSPNEKVLADNIQAHCDNACVDLCGKTRLLEAIDLLSLASAVVSNDSGLMHTAAALQKPLVVLYGSSSAKFTPPLSESVKMLSLNLPCSPCFKRECPLGHFKCLNDLTPQQALEALETLSGTTAP